MISLASGAARPRAVSTCKSAVGQKDPGGKQQILGQIPGCLSAAAEHHVFIERVIEAGTDQPGGDVAEQHAPGPGAGRRREEQEQAVIQRKAEQ